MSMFDAALDRRQFLGATGLAGALALAPGWAFARAGAPDWSLVKTLFDGFVAEGKLPGAAAAIGRGLDPAQFVVAGTVGRGRDRPVDADSLYRVYSMSKPITAMAAMILIEEGKIGLDQNVGDFIPGLKKPTVIVDQMTSLESKPATKPVTVRGLMTHTAGLGYIIVSKGKLLEAYAKLGLTGGVVSRMDIPILPKVVPAPTLKEFGDRIASLPLMYEPGTRWSYSAGLDVLGRVIEVASGMPFDRFLQTRIFDPLGMKSSFFHVPVSELPRLVTNYGVANGQQFPIDGGTDSIYTDTSTIPLGGGGLVMSPRDYDRFLLMLAGKGAIGSVRIMKPETAALAMSNLLTPDVMTSGTFADGQGFGAGGRVTIKPTPGGAGMGTYGWGGAAATIAFVDPTKGIRASGFAQFMPSEAIPFTTEFSKSVYASL
jgi:CubicO group peptidase (beta-lactamase class C family)